MGMHNIHCIVEKFISKKCMLYSLEVSQFLEKFMML